MKNNLDTLVIALYVKIDDDMAGIPRLPGRPPKLSHAELICLAVMQAMLGFTSEAHWLLANPAARRRPALAAATFRERATAPSAFGIAWFEQLLAVPLVTYRRGFTMKRLTRQVTGSKEIYLACNGQVKYTLLLLRFNWP
nr:hypothetical protein [Actinomadura rubrisoli]